MSLATCLGLCSALAFSQPGPLLVPESLLPAPVEFVVGKRWQRPSVISQMLIVEVDRHVLVTVDPELDQAFQRGLEWSKAPQEVLMDSQELMDRLLATGCDAVRVLSRPQIRTIAGSEAGVQFGQAMVVAPNERALLPETGLDFSFLPRRMGPNGVECHVTCKQVERLFQPIEPGVDGEFPPREWTGQKSAKYTARFGETVLVPCTESRMSQMLVFLNIRSVEP